MARLAVLSVLLLASSMGAVAQEASAHEDARRQFALFLGAGPSLGWLGAQAELYGDDRVSAFLAVGVSPMLLDQGEGANESVPPAFAGGIRAYTSDATHRGFVEASISQVWGQTFTTLGASSVDWSYGPGVQLGYQYRAGGGFTVFGSAGAGVPLTNSSGAPGVVPLLGLGLGYTH